MSRESGGRRKIYVESVLTCFERGPAKPPKSELGQIPRGGLGMGWGGGVCTYVVQQKNRQRFILETAPQKCVNSGVVFIPVLVCKKKWVITHMMTKMEARNFPYDGNFP